MSHEGHIHGKGKSSFELIDAAKFLELSELKPGMTFADLGCGRGQYTLLAAEAVGSTGSLIAFDLWPEGIEELRAEATRRGVSNLRAEVSNIAKPLSIEDESVDVCLVSTILHDVGREHPGLLDEVRRILKTGGMLAVIEFKKIPDSPGPPMEIRLPPEETETMVTPFGFKKVQSADIGDYNYLIIFRK